MTSKITVRDSELFLEYVLRMTKGRLKLVGVVSSALTMLAVAMAFILLVVVADHFWPAGLPKIARAIWRWGFLLTELGLLVGTIVVPLLRRLNDLYIARLIEKSNPRFRNDLTASLELPGQHGVHSGTLAAVKRHAADEVAASDVESSVKTRRIRMTGLAAAVAIAAMLVYSMVSGKDVWPSMMRAFGANEPAPLWTKLDNVMPASGEVVLAGQTVVFEVNVTGGDQTPAIRISRDGGKSFLPEDSSAMILAGKMGQQPRKFTHHWIAAAVDRQACFEIRCGDAVTPIRTLTVLPQPKVWIEQIHLVWPEYTGWSTEQTDSNIEALPGTQAHIRIRTNLPVAEAFLQIENGKMYRATPPDAGSAAASQNGQTLALPAMEITSEGRYRLQFISTYKGVESHETGWFRIHLIDDPPPTVRLINPTARKEMPADGTLDLAADAADRRFGLQSVVLVADAVSNEKPARIPLKEYPRIAGRLPEQDRLRASLPVTQLGKPGTSLLCHLEATDAKGQVAKSAEQFELVIADAETTTADQPGASAPTQAAGNQDADKPQQPAATVKEQAAKEILEMARRAEDAATLEQLRKQFDLPDSATIQQAAAKEVVQQLAAQQQAVADEAAKLAQQAQQATTRPAGDAQAAQQTTTQPAGNSSTTQLAGDSQQAATQQASGQNAQQNQQAAQAQAAQQARQDPGQQANQQAGQEVGQQTGQQTGQQGQQSSQQAGQQTGQANQAGQQTAQGQQAGQQSAQSGQQTEQQAGQQAAQGLHANDGTTGDPNSGSAKERGQVDLPQDLAVTPAERAKLESIGLAINAAAQTLRSGQVDPALLKSIGMTAQQFNAFVEQYSGRFGQLKPAPDATGRPGETVQGAYGAAGTAGVQQGRGTDANVGLTGAEKIKADAAGELLQPDVSDVSPEYRKQVEAYLKAISEARASHD